MSASIKCDQFHETTDDIVIVIPSLPPLSVEPDDDEAGGWKGEEPFACLPISVIFFGCCLEVIKLEVESKTYFVFVLLMS